MKEPATLADLIKHLENIYCDSIGVEYMHINNVEEKDFIKRWLQVNENHPTFLRMKKQKFY
jgi:2-oxoglutarate dehydrogenase E1 component